MKKIDRIKRELKDYEQIFEKKHDKYDLGVIDGINLCLTILQEKDKDEK